MNKFKSEIAAIKFKTPEEVEELLVQYEWHCNNGFSDECFVPCDMRTFRKYVEKMNELQTKRVDEAQRKRQMFWEGMGTAGTFGHLPGFNGNAWRYNMANRFDWRDKRDVDVMDKREINQGEKDNILREGLEELPPTASPASTPEEAKAQ